MTGPDEQRPRVIREARLVRWGLEPGYHSPWLDAGVQEAPVAGVHQEGERREDPCGCQHIWCRGRWHPSGLMCGRHWPDDPEAAAVMRRGPDE